MEPEPDLWFCFFDNATLLLNILSAEVIFGVLGVIILLMMSALVSGSEVAYFSLSPGEIKDLNKSDKKSSRKILKHLEHPRRLLATILVSNNFINIAIVLLSDIVLKKALPKSVFHGWAQQIIDFFNLSQRITIEEAANDLGFLVTVIGVTFLLVLFGEVAPKVYSQIYRFQIAHLMAGPLTVLNKVFYRINMLLIYGTSFIEKRLSDKGPSSGTSLAEIDEAINLTVKNEQANNKEIDLLRRIVKFGEVSVKQIMKPRMDVIALDFRNDFKETLQVVRASNYSRLPVYDEDFDTVIGILYSKDLLGKLGEDKEYEWQELIHTNSMFVPETKKIDILLKEFQEEKMHMAIVVDEYGGSSGIVTLEDILEEIVGDIKDEIGKQDLLPIKKISKKEYSMDGKLQINDLCRFLEQDPDLFANERGDADTVAGMILENTGIMPEIESSIELVGYTFIVKAIEKHRISEILMKVK